MVNILVDRLDKDLFLVKVLENDSETNHKVKVSDKNLEDLTHNKINKKELIKLSFEFLLKRESKESILAEFDIIVISTYFPEYKNELKNILEY